MPQLESRSIGALPKVRVNRVAQHADIVGSRRFARQAHDQAQRLAGWRFAAPVHDVAVRVRVEIALAKRRGIHGVEQLPHLGDVQFQYRAGL